MGQLNIAVIHHCQKQCPNTLASIGHSLRKHNAAFPRSALIVAHFRGLVRSPENLGPCAC